MLASKQAGWLLSGSLLAGLLSAGFIGRNDQWQARTLIEPSPAIEVVQERFDSATWISESGERHASVESNSLDPDAQSSSEVNAQVDVWLQARTLWR